MSDRDDKPATSSTAPGDEGDADAPDRRLLPDGGVRGRSGAPGADSAIAFGVAGFAILAAGAMTMSLLSSWLVDSTITVQTIYTHGGGSGDPLYMATYVAYTRVIQLGILLAIVLGVYLAQQAETPDAGAIRGTAANGVGTGLTLVVLTGLLLLTAPGDANVDVVEHLRPVVAVTAGTVVAGAGAGYATVALREH